jgi:leucyl-tRNA synthetase
VAWSTKGLLGPKRFLDKVWKLQDKLGSSTSESVETQLHKTIKKVGEDIGEMKYNTAISEMMILINEVERVGGISKADFESLLKILSPFAPHMTQELWETLGNEGFIMEADWPSYDESKLVEATVTVAVQVNGKVRAELEVAADATEGQVKELALANEAVDNWIKKTGDGVVKRFVYITGRVANIVVQ